MKTTPLPAAIALWIAMVPTVSIANHYIETAGEQIVLQEPKCKTGGQEATLIEKRSNGGGAYGCWELKDGYVYVHWTLAVGPNGSNLRMDKVDRYPAPSSLVNASRQRPTGADKSLIDQMEKLNSQCRGGSGDNPATMKACDQRDAVMAQITRRGWCWGPDSVPEASKGWIRCR